jgi:hypothetical protein
VDWLIIVLMVGVLLLLYQARRVQDGKSEVFQSSSRNWLLFSAIPIGLLALSGVLIATGERSLTHVPIMLVMAGLALFMWWKAWRLRQLGQ